MTAVDSASYYNMKGNSLYFAGKYRESLKVFLQYDALVKRHPDMVFDRVVCDVNLADNYIHLHQDDKVGGKLDDALAFFEKNGITAYSPYVHTLQILHLVNMHRNAEALALAQSVEKEIPMMNPDHRVARYNVMSLCMERNGKFSEAVRYDKLFNTLDDSLRNVQAIALADETDKRYDRDSQQKQHQITLQQRDIKELGLYIILLVVFSVLLLSIIVNIYYRRRSRRRYYNAVNKILSLRGEIVRNRLTPHFISNVLALGHNLSDDDMDSIVLLIRDTLSYGNNITASLEKEIELSSHYIRVASLIYNGKIQLESDIDPTLPLDSYVLPAMSLSTLMENAVKHGTPDDQGVLYIKISIKHLDLGVCVKIINGGQLTDYDKAHDRAWHGLQMIHQMVCLVNKKHPNSMAFIMENNTDHSVLSTITTTLKF